MSVTFYAITPTPTPKKGEFSPWVTCTRLLAGSFVGWSEDKSSLKKKKKQI